MTIVYALVSRQKTVLAEYTATSGERRRKKKYRILVNSSSHDSCRHYFGLLLATRKGAGDELQNSVTSLAPLFLYSRCYQKRNI